MTGRQRLPGEVRAWGAVSLLSDLGHEAVTSLLPAFLASLGAPPAALGWVEGISDGISAVAKPLGGRLADRLRRLKPVAAGGYFLTAAALPAIAAAAAWPWVALLRGVAWAGRGLRSPIRDTLMSRAVAPEARGRAFGLERAMDQVGAVAAPLLVTALVGFGVGMRPIIVLSCLPATAAVVLVLAAVREHPLPPAAASRSGAGRAGLPAPFRRFLLAVALFGAGDFAKTLLVLWALGPGGGLGPGAIPKASLLYGFFNLVTIGAALLGGRLSDSLGRRPVLVGAYLLGAGGAVLPVLAPPSVPAALAALFLSGILVGAQESVERAWAADLSPEGKRGRAFGFLHLTNGLGDLVASVGVGWIWTAVGPEAAFGSAAAVMGAGSLLLLRVPVGEDRPPRLD